MLEVVPKKMAFFPNFYLISSHIYNFTLQNWSIGVRVKGWVFGRCLECVWKVYDDAKDILEKVSDDGDDIFEKV